MKYLPPVKRLPALATRIRKGAYPLHEGSGVYCVLNDTGIVRTKHVRSMETSFFGLTGIGSVNASTWSEDPTVIGLRSKFGSQFGDHSYGDEPTNSTVLEYIPLTEQETDFDSDSLAAVEDDNGNDDSDPNPQPEPPHLSIFRIRTLQNSRCMADSNTMTTSDEPKSHCAEDTRTG